MSCGGGNKRTDAEPAIIEADSAAMSSLAGIWVDAVTESVAFRVEGDSLFYPDTTILPVRFAIFEDTLVLFTADTVCYPLLEKHDHSLVYESLSGDPITLYLSEDPADSILFFAAPKEYAPVLLNEEVSRDTVVFSPTGERYHLYIKVNPTHYRVYQTTYTDEGLAMEKVYYDNIIHIGVFQGRKSLFSRDFVKADFAEFVPEPFLEGAILSNADFGDVDREGCHFNVTLCQPDGASCYVISLIIDKQGNLEKKLLEY